MEAIIPARNLKIFSKSIQCMAKIGEELYLEAADNKLMMRTFNSSRSAYLAFYIDAQFFDTFYVESTDKKYQVKLKPCSAVFKQYNNVENCTIRVDDHEQRLVFELLCKHGIKKVYKLAFEECETLQAVYSKDSCTNKIATFPKKLLDCFLNFHNQLDEISLLVAKDSVKVKSHVEDAKSASKLLQTELSMDPTDFEEYDIRNDTQVTFQLKDAKTLLSFCESTGQQVSVFFERSGKPIILNVRYFGIFEADFVLATLVDPAATAGGNGSGASSSQSSASSTPASNENRKRNNTHLTPSPSIHSYSTPSGKARSPPPSPRNEEDTTNIHPSSGSSAISSSTTPRPQSPNHSVHGAQPSYHDSDLLGDYEDEVNDSPPNKKSRTSQTAMDTSLPLDNEINNRTDNMDQDNNNDDDEEEIPCSVEEDER